MKNNICLLMLMSLLSLNAFAKVIISVDKSVALTVTPEALPEVLGEIKKVDLEQKKLTIKHQDIPNLNMPGMTMVFKVKESVVITNLKAGDKISFTVDTINGSMTVLTLKKLN